MAGSPRHGPHEIQNLLNARGRCRLGTYCVPPAGPPVGESPKTCSWFRGAVGVAHGYRPSRRPWLCRGYVAGPPPSNACGPAGPGMAARTVAVRPGNGDPVLGKRRRAGHLPRELPHVPGGSLIQKLFTCQADNRVTPQANRIVIQHTAHIVKHLGPSVPEKRSASAHIVSLNG